MSPCVLLAGKSGSGKTVLAAKVGVPVLSLDVFFRPADRALPTWMGATDWNHIASYDTQLAVAAVLTLIRDGAVEVPEYDLSADRVSGSTTLRVGVDGFVAEGAFAPIVYEEAKAAMPGAPMALLVLKTGRVRTLIDKIRRDRSEGRLGSLLAVATAIRLFARTPRGQSAAHPSETCDRLLGAPAIRQVLIALGAQGLAEPDRR